MNRLLSTCVLPLVFIAFNTVRAQTGTPPLTVSGTSTVAPNGSAGSEKPSNAGERNSELQRQHADAKKHYKQGVKYGRAKLYKQAAATFMQAIRVNPKYADAYYGLGHAFLDLGRLNEAIDAFQQVIKLDPKDEEAYARLGEAHARLRAEAASGSEKPSEKPLGEKIALSVSADAAVTRTVPTVPTSDNEIIRTYRVGVGDVLDVRLQNAPPDQSTLFTVSPAGLLEHPILSRPLNVSGKTTDEIRTIIESDLKSRAVNINPEVMVGVREYASHTILVSGLVKDPGTKILRREAIPLYVVIADAQLLPEAGRASIVSGETGQTVVVDLSDSSAMNKLVRSGDVITVQPSVQQYFYIGGEVKVPGEKSFRAGLKLTQGILVAGGLTRKSEEAQVARENEAGLLVVTRHNLKEINLGKLPDPFIQPGDRITIVH
ncbi:MAG: tetratricopeptide repeat protein [Pyrinomonadaceae bacterium]